MQTARNFFHGLLTVSLVLTLISCDDTTPVDDVDVDEVPELPSFEEMQMQTDAFSGSSYSINEKGGADEQWQYIPEQIADKDLITPNDVALFDPGQFPSYEVASTLIGAFTNHHQQKLNFVNNYFDDWDKEEVEISGDEYVWNYDVEDPETGESLSIRVTASIAGDEVNWVVIAEWDAENGGFEEQQIMEGTSAFDGSTGYWTLTLDVPEDDFSFKSTSSWVFNDEHLAELDFEYFLSGESGYVDTQGTYERDDEIGRIYDGRIDSPALEDAAENLPWDIDLTQIFQIEWNFESEAGSITIGEEEFCWDGNQEPYDC